MDAWEVFVFQGLILNPCVVEKLKKHVQTDEGYFLCLPDVVVKFLINQFLDVFVARLLMVQVDYVFKLKIIRHLSFDDAHEVFVVLSIHEPPCH